MRASTNKHNPAVFRWHTKLLRCQRLFPSESTLVSAHCFHPKMDVRWENSPAAQYHQHPWHPVWARLHTAGFYYKAGTAAFPVESYICFRIALSALFWNTMCLNFLVRNKSAFFLSSIFIFHFHFLSHCSSWIRSFETDPRNIIFAFFLKN